ncbi:hypothetical protein COP1_030307 [Malus domestica]
MKVLRSQIPVALGDCVNPVKFALAAISKVFSVCGELRNPRGMKKRNKIVTSDFKTIQGAMDAVSEKRDCDWGLLREYVDWGFYVG